MEKRKNKNKHHTLDTQDVSPFAAGDHKAARNRHDKDRHETQMTKSIHKRSTTLERSVRKLPDCITMFDNTRTSLTIISVVAQDK